MPPPTMNMAMVPTRASRCIRRGAVTSSPCPTARRRRRHRALQQVQTDVVELDDEPHQAIDPDGHQQGDARYHGDLQAQARPCTVPRAMTMISAERMKSVQAGPSPLAPCGRQIGHRRRLMRLFLVGRGTCGPASPPPRNRGGPSIRAG